MLLNVTARLTQWCSTHVTLLLQVMSQPALSAAVPDELQQPPLATSDTQTASDALPMLTSLTHSQPASRLPSSSMGMQPQPALGTPQTSPRIKPPPSLGSFPHSQAGTPLWQMLGSAANIPAGVFTGKESLDLDVLAKAAVKKRKEQVQHAGLLSSHVSQAPARQSILRGTCLASHTEPFCPACRSCLHATCAFPLHCRVVLCCRR